MRGVSHICGRWQHGPQQRHRVGRVNPIRHMQGLWRGTTPALALVVPYCAVQFAVLSHCKSLAAANGADKTRWAPAISFGGGAIAGAAATAASYPFDLLRTVLASQGSPPVYRGMTDAAAGIMRQRGVRGLFSGMGITLAEIIPYAGIQFGVYDSLKRAADRMLPGPPEQMTPSVSFAKEFAAGFLAGLIGKVRRSNDSAIAQMLIGVVLEANAQFKACAARTYARPM